MLRMRGRPHRSFLFSILALLAAAVGLALIPASGAGRPAQPTRLFYAQRVRRRLVCARATPCRSFARAYRAARPGEIVEVAGGSYGPQEIPSDSSKRSPADVVFQPAKRASVTIGCRSDGMGCLDISGSHVTLRGMHVANLPSVNGYAWQGSIDTERGCSDVSLLGMDAGSFNAACSNLRIVGGDWGPTIDPHNSRIVEECVNCLFDGLLIHDYAIAQGGHMECITFEGGTNVMIRRSEFRSARSSRSSRSRPTRSTAH